VRKILKIMLLVLMLCFKINVVDAASFKISANSSLSKGSSTKLTIKGTDVTGRFNIKSSNPGVVSISEDRAWIENDSYTITLSALSVGSSIITVTPSGVSDSSGNAANLSAKTIKITVSLPREKDTDNTLSSLSVEGYELNPVFNKNTLDYTINVPEGTKKVKISAKATSKYASVSGTGEKEVIEGVNNLNVVVKAENGSEQIYNLIINVKDEFPINVNIDNTNYTVIKLRENFKCDANYTETETVINNILVPTCSNNAIDYTLVGLKDETGNVHKYIYKNNTYQKYHKISNSNIELIIMKYDGIIDDYEKVDINIDGEKYQAFQFNNSKEYIIYGMNIETGSKDLYIYDSENKTFSTYYSDYSNYLKELNKNYIYVIIATLCALFLSIICIFILLSKNKKRVSKINSENVLNNTEQSEQTTLESNENKEEVAEDTVLKEEEEIIDATKTITNLDEIDNYHMYVNKKKLKKKKNTSNE